MLGEAVADSLRLEGWAVDWVRDGVAAEAALRTPVYSVVLLDLGLPSKSDLEVLRDLRARGDGVPVLIMTARDDVDDRVRGLDAGADDYMAKPLDMTELFARIRALARRHAGQAAPVLRAGEVELDPAAHRVTVAGRPVEVSVREFNVLRALVEAHGKLLSRSQIEDALYGWGSEVESNAVEVHIHRLRRKLGPERIQTVRGAGYRVRSA